MTSRPVRELFRSDDSELSDGDSDNFQCEECCVWRGRTVQYSCDRTEACMVSDDANKQSSFRDSFIFSGKKLIVRIRTLQNMAEI